MKSHSNFFYTTVYNQWSWSTVYVPAGWTHSMPENTVLASIAWSYWSKTRISNPWFLLFWTIQSFAACWTGMDTHVLDVQGTNAVQRIRWRTTVTINLGKSKLEQWVKINDQIWNVICRRLQHRNIVLALNL